MHLLIVCCCCCWHLGPLSLPLSLSSGQQQLAPGTRCRFKSKVRTSTSSFLSLSLLHQQISGKDLFTLTPHTHRRSTGRASVRTHSHQPVWTEVKDHSCQLTRSPHLWEIPYMGKSKSLSIFHMLVCCSFWTPDILWLKADTLQQDPVSGIFCLVKVFPANVFWFLQNSLLLGQKQKFTKPLKTKWSLCTHH